MTVATLFSCLYWSDSQPFLTCINTAFQPPMFFSPPVPGKPGETSQNQAKPAGKVTNAA